MENALVEKLKTEINKELQDCDPKLWPMTCKMRADDEGYEKIEKMIILYVSKEAMPVGAAIALIEQELQHGKG